MTGWMPHLVVPQNRILFAALLFLVFSGCKKKEPPAEYLARVNDTHLTTADLSRLADTSGLSQSEKQEWLRNWVNEELLFQLAEKEGVVDSPEFEAKINSTRRQLAISIYLEKHFEESYSPPEEELLKQFYEKNRHILKLKANAFVFNAATFSSEELAGAFRERLLSDSWQRAIKTLPKGELVLSNSEGAFEYDYELTNFTVKRFLESFNPGEISIIFSARPGEYSIVQLVAAYKLNEVPPLNVIHEQVLMLYKEEQMKEAIKKMLAGLYEKNEIEIK